MAIIQSNPIYPDQAYRRDLINVFFRFVDGKVRAVCFRAPHYFESNLGIVLVLFENSFRFEA